MTELIKLQFKNAKIIDVRNEVLNELRQKDLYRPDLLYRGFSSSMINQVLEHGSESPDSHFVYANPEDHLDIDPDTHWVNPLTYALCYGALAVYRGDKLRQRDYTTYEFRDMNTKPETLVAVFSLQQVSD